MALAKEHPNVAPELYVSAVQPLPQGVTPALDIATDMVRRGYLAAIPATAATIWLVGPAAGFSLALGIFIAGINYIFAGLSLSWASNKRPDLLASMTVSGFFFRLTMLAAAVVLLAGYELVNVVWLTITIVVAHLGLLFWELQYVSTTLAHPGLKPKVAGYTPAAGYKPTKKDRTSART